MIGLPKHAVLACLSRCLRTVLGRLQGQADNGQGDSKMSGQREMLGWPGTRFPEGDGLKPLAQVSARKTPDARATASAFDADNRHRSL
jgi:hypothetical protein